MYRFQRFAGRHAITTAIVLLVLVAVVLLNLPLAEVISRILKLDAVRAIMAHKKLVLSGGLLIAAGVGAWAIRGRHFRSLAASIGLAVLAGLAYGVFKFQQVYPLADFFSLARYRDTGAILLGKDVLLSQYDPQATLKVEREVVTRAAYPAIDIHFHLESLPPWMTPELLVKAMDAAGIAKIVNLGGLPGMFEHFASTFQARYPDRIIQFVKPDPSALEREDGVKEQLQWIAKAARMGARGVKENKSFGLGQRDASGKLVPVDDERLAPLWDLAGRLGMPVLIHTGEPKSFYAPIDKHNERYQELLENPEWSLYGAEGPSYEELMQQRERLLARHPATNFIGAHMAMNPDDLTYLGQLLDKYPNFFVDMSSVVQELGRQPYTARRFFIRYQDRILFGTDGGFGLQLDTGWTAERMFRSHVEFLETSNEYIEYPMYGITKQGKWQVYGLDLPAEVLEKIYVRNAERLLPSDASIAARLDALSLP